MIAVMSDRPSDSGSSTRTQVSRRTVVKSAAALIGCSAAPAFLARSARAAEPTAFGQTGAAAVAGAEWYVTTAASPWQTGVAETASGGGADVFVQTDTRLQAIEGFGACFNELGWAALSALSVADRDSVTVGRDVSHFVRPGARRLETASWTGYENQLAFANPDGNTVIVIQNDLAEPCRFASEWATRPSRPRCQPTRSALSL